MNNGPRNWLPNPSTFKIVRELLDELVLTVLGLATLITVVILMWRMLQST